MKPHPQRRLPMRNVTLLRFSGTAGLAALLLALPYFHHSVCAQTVSQSSAQSAGDVVTTTLTDQADLAVTVYNSNIALVRDVRQITLAPGDSRLKFMDIASSINPATVHFRSLTEPTKLGVVEQNYEYDLLDPNKLLQKYAGREAPLMRGDQEVKGTLLANNNGQVWKIGTEIVTTLSHNSLRFPEVPDNLYERPTLLWTLQNTGARQHKVEASYLTANLSWSADYVLNVTKD